jgi:phage shock protein PspC (stress-responsive transcriptional regulator)
VLLGVAGGLAAAAGIDPVIVRVLFAATALLGGAGLLVYLALAAVLPVREDDHRPGEAGSSPDETSMVLVVGGLAGVLLIGAGLVFLAIRPGGFDLLTVVTPWLIVLVTVVAGLVIGRRRWED